MLQTFDDLIEMACRETDPAMLLTCVLRSDAMKAAGGNGAEMPIEDEGVLRPIMVKAHEVSPELKFETIRAEVETGQPDWTFIMLAVLPGWNGQPPPPDQVDEQLKNMARVIHIGSGLDRYLFIDRNGEFVQLQSEMLAE